MLIFFKTDQTLLKIINSFQEKRIEIKTVYELLWWVLFEWHWHNNSYFILWSFTDVDPTVNLKRFLENNCFRWFSDLEYQYWTLSNLNGSTLKFNGSLYTDKLEYKKYIFDYNADLNYFNNKIKEASATKNIKFQNLKKLVAIDENYRMYYF